MNQRRDLEQRIVALIDQLADGSRDDEGRDALLEEVRAYQAANVTTYGRWLAQAGVADAALPTDVFRHVRVCAHEPSDDVVVFRTSGTTHGLRGEHCLRDLSLYDKAAWSAARYALFPDVERVKIVILAPSASDVSDSSLSYMLQRFVNWFGTQGSTHVWKQGRVDLERLQTCLTQAQDEGAAVALLGTSFAFVHADEGLAKTHFRLPPGSRIMQTGGFKGKSRELSPADMDVLLSNRYGVPTSLITQEYGMTELCSQMYGSALRSSLLSSPRAVPGYRSTSALWVPGWVRVSAVDPHTLRSVKPGEVGVLRIDDLANLDTVSAIQTADLARVTNEGLHLLGRSPSAIPRGCSLAIEEAYEAVVGVQR